MYSTISVPVETKQLIRRIQKADQLNLTINLQKYLQDTALGRDLLESIDDVICTGRNYYPKPVKFFKFKV